MRQDQIMGKNNRYKRRKKRMNNDYDYENYNGFEDSFKVHRQKKNQRRNGGRYKRVKDSDYDSQDTSYSVDCHECGGSGVCGCDRCIAAKLSCFSCDGYGFIKIFQQSLTKYLIK